MNKPSVSSEVTIFEKIIKREIPAVIIYEDDSVVSFLDINPINKGHALIIPKQHYINIFDIPPDILSYMIIAAQKIARGITAATNAEGVNVLMNNETAAGQEVFHAHIHVIPRFKKDEAFQPAHHTTYENITEQNILAEKIKNALT